MRRVVSGNARRSHGALKRKRNGCIVNSAWIVLQQVVRSQEVSRSQRQRPSGERLGEHLLRCTWGEE